MSVHKSQTSGAETGERQPMQLDQLKFLAHLDRDAFGKIMLAESGSPPRVCAVKVIEKKALVENDETANVHTAKRVSMIVNGARHPFLTHLFSCFQTESCVYFVTEYNAGGSLMHHLQHGAFQRQRAQLYAAEICMAVKYLHEKGIIHRNLQLENIWLARDGHIKVSDYGLCKDDIWHGSTTSTFCGTASFMAPEILLDKKYSRPVDWWNFGVILYQMLLNKAPFTGEDEDEIYDAILGEDLHYPADMPKNDSSILQKLLLRDPEQRLGSGSTDAQEIMTHPFFQDVVWDDVYHKKVQPSFVPTLQSETDTSNFDAEYTNLPPVLGNSQSPLTQASQDKFKDFDYVADFALE